MIKYYHRIYRGYVIHGVIHVRVTIHPSVVSRYDLWLHNLLKIIRNALPDTGDSFNTKNCKGNIECIDIKFSNTCDRLDMPKTKQIESKIFDFPLPFSPVIALNC